MADNTVKSESKEKKVSFWQGVKQEWGKIIWPNRQKIVKSTIAVCLIALVLGILIAVIDAGALKLLNLIIG
ncbi:MAG: preprotein translocase subunit SecE [Lachnospiraceae bacterium]|nr:preprotein translocase subunit SecE [Lachnospiraceae bacterium]